MFLSYYRCSCKPLIDSKSFHKGIREINTPDNSFYYSSENNVPINNIYIIRKKLNLSVKDFAKLCNLSEASITKAETRRSPRIDTIKKVAYATNETISFVGGFYNLPEGNFAEKLYKAIKYHGHSHESCAKYIGVNPHTILRYLHGDIPKNIKIKKSLQLYVGILKKEYPF